VRPILAVVGGAVLVLVALACYFVPAGTSQTATVYDTSPQILQAPPQGYSFLGQVPVTLTVSGLPPGSWVGVSPCPMGASSVAQCTASPQFLSVYNYSANVGSLKTVTLEFDINSGHPFLVSTSASQGGQLHVTATVPLWAVDTWFILAALVAGVVLVAVGLHHEPKPRAPTYYVETSGYAAAPGPRRFCETCGAPFQDPTTAFCTNCGAPRG
jgi:hypothetical protein